MENEVKSLVEQVKCLCQQQFEKNDMDQASWTQLMCWVAADFKSDDDHGSLTSRDWAEMYMAGVPAMTFDRAQDYFEEQFEACEDDQQAIDGVIQRVKDFFRANK